MSNSKNLVRALTATAVIAVAGCSNGNGNSAKGGDLANPPPPTSADYEMVWSDEFDGNSLNSNNWEVQTGNGAEEGIPGWGNNELQYYTADNISVEDGRLVIEARLGGSPDPDFNYTSGRIRTQGKVDITYGRIEARIKVPPGVGLWAAFWMLGSEPSVYGGWASRGEIDILESFGGDDPFSQAALHYGMQAPQNQLVSKRWDVDPTDGFHEYAVEWDIDQIRWYIDGQHFYTVRNSSYWNYYYRDMMSGFQEGGPSAPFDEDQHILLNMAVGGNLPGDPTDTSVFPARMLVDYVRVYQCPIDPENTGLGCANSIDPVDPFIIAEVPEAEAFTASYDLYTDGLQTLFEDSGSDRVLGFEVFDNDGALMIEELTNSDGVAVIDVLSSGGGNVSVQDVTGAPFNLFGMGTGEPDSGFYGGDIKFDLQIISGADTDLSGSLQVRMDSGFPDVGYVEIPLSEFPVDQVTSVGVPISDILQSNQGVFGGGIPDISEIINLVTFEPTGPVHLQISNIRLECGAPEACGIEATASVPFDVYIDEVDPRWGRGIRGFDTIVGGDYGDNASGNHVTWREFDTGEEGHDTVIETSFDTNGASGLTFIGAPDDETIDLSAYADGELAFDVRFISNPNDLPLIYKVDGVDGAGTGERSLGQLELNTWTSFAIPVATLQSQGLVLADVTAFVLMPTFAGQDAVFQWDNVRFEPDLSGEAEQVGLPVDFELENAFYNLINFNGGASIVLPNPVQEGINTSATVVQMQKFADQTFGGTTLVLDIPIDFSLTEVMKMKVWSPRPVAVTLKLEAANAEVVGNHGGSGWEELSFDFTGRTVEGEVGITIIFDNGILGQAADDPDNWTFYYDDIATDSDVAPPTGGDGATGCAQCTDFESGDTVFEDFGSPVAPVSSLIADPVDASNTVAQTIKPLGAPATAGTSVDPGEIVYPLTTTNSVITVRIYSPDAGVPVRLRLEDMNNSSRYVEAEAVTQLAGIWETLVFDFNDPVDGSPSLNPSYTYDNLSIFFNYGTDGDTAGEKTYLWDTIEFVSDGTSPPIPPPDGGISYRTGFEFADPNGEFIGDDWTFFVSVFDLNGNFVYNYGPFPAPNSATVVSSIGRGEAGPEQGSQYLNTFSDYSNQDQPVATLVTSIFQERTIEADDGGNYLFTFDAKAPASAGAALAPPSTARAYIKVLDQVSGSFDELVVVDLDVSDLPNNTWVTNTIEVPIDAGELEGQLLQFGFENTATDFDPSGVLYDNVIFYEESDGPPPPVQPPIEPPIEPPKFTNLYSTNFESFDLGGTPGTLIGDGWTFFGIVFDPTDTTFQYGYGPFPSPNDGGAISSIATGEGGPSQGDKYLNAFSDYGNGPAHNAGEQVHTLNFQERNVATGGDGAYAYTFSFQAKTPSDPMAALRAPSTALAFIKILDQIGGTFFELVVATVELNAVPDDKWTTYKVEMTIDATDAPVLEGQLLQFGFENTATNFNSSGLYFDNVDMVLAK